MQADVAGFKSQGFVHVKGFFSQREIDVLRDDIIAAGRAQEDESSLNKGNMKFLCNIHRHSEKLQDFVCQDRLVSLLTPYVGDDFWVRWDQCVCKAPGAPDFPWHQDNAYNDLHDQHYQLWVAISATTKDNGGLWLAPGSHRRGRLPHHKDGGHMVADESPSNPMLVEAERGDVVLFSSLMLHHTKANVSNDDRWAYVIEYMRSQDFDPHVDSPYLIVARNGRREQRFEPSYPGARSIRNRVKYFGVKTVVTDYAKQALSRFS